MNVKITDIQHFCLHDGPGIRTTVFLKGCNLKCPWCANPECISSEIQGEFGFDISIEDLEKELLKDEAYYAVNSGGVTFSGGEPLLQIRKLEDLLKSLKSKNIHICFETALFVNSDLLKIAIRYVDEFIIDIKVLSKEECKIILGGNIDLYLNNLKLLDDKKITFRIPLVPNYTITDKNLEYILQLLKNYPNCKVEIFKIHNLAKKKYETLGLKQYYDELDDELVESILSKLNCVVNDVEIITY